MLMTSILLFIAMRDIWQWTLAASLALAGFFCVIDSLFLASNLTKVLEGGYVPLLLAVAVYSVMYIWHRGILATRHRLDENPLSITAFLAGLAAEGVVRVPGTAVFLTRAQDATPPVMVWYVKHSHALHEHVVVATLETAPVPRIAAERRLQVSQMGRNFWVASARYGFMERPDLPRLMHQLRTCGCIIDPDKLTYFVGSERIVPREDGHGLPRWMEALFAAMLRNSVHIPDYLNVPREQLIDLGRQVAI
jgi:KUP system potassium uptake protein